MSDINNINNINNSDNIVNSDNVVNTDNKVRKPINKTKLLNILGASVCGVALATGVGLSISASIKSKDAGGEKTTPVAISQTIDTGIQSIKFLVDGKEVTQALPGSTVEVQITEKTEYALKSLTCNGLDILSAKKFVMPQKECKIVATTTSDVTYITLDLNGGSAQTTQVKIKTGDYFYNAELPAVTKAGFTEGEWYFDAELTKLVTPDAIITESVTIHKNWFNKVAAYPGCTAVHANKDSELLAIYDNIQADTNNVMNDEPSYRKGNIDLDTIQYSTDGTTWKSYTREAAITIPAGTNLYLIAKRNEQYTTASSVFTHFKFDGEVTLGGNIVGLLDEGKGEITEIGQRWLYGLFESNTAIKAVARDYLPAAKVGEQSYERLFYGCSNLNIAPELPATSIGSYSYYSMFENCNNLYVAPTAIGTTQMGYAACTKMFKGCENLLVAPKLQAKELLGSCYAEMFEDCKSITKLPELPATTIPHSGYDRMFSGCIGITEVPTDMLKAETLSEFCYNEMFEGCTSLTNVPTLPATVLANDCYNKMFNKCYSLKTVPTDLLSKPTTMKNGCYSAMFQYCTSLTNAPELPAQTLASDCYLNMFYGCSNLLVAPELPATRMEYGSYSAMFAFCEKLTVAPTLPATYLEDECYSSMFYGCTKLETAVIGGANSIQSIYEAALQQMFDSCYSLKSVKLNYSGEISEWSFRRWLSNTNVNMTLYYDGPSTSFNCDAIPSNITIKPYTASKIFVQVTPSDLIDGSVTDKYIEPRALQIGDTAVYQDIERMYKTKYGVVKMPRFVVENTTTIGQIYSGITEGNYIKPLPGCVLKKMQYYNGKSWVDCDSTTTAVVNENTKIRPVFAPTKIITCTWAELSTAVKKLYDVTSEAGWEAWNAAKDTFCAEFKDQGWQPTDLYDFLGVEREVKINGKNHTVAIARCSSGSGYSSCDVLTTRGNCYTYTAIFTFRFVNPICDENGYTLGTTFNGAGNDGNCLDYSNSDLRKAVDGTGNGTVRWYEKQGSAPTTSSKYNGKTVAEMIDDGGDLTVSNLTQVNKTYYKGTAQESGEVYWSTGTYAAKLFVPSSNDCEGYYFSPYEGWLRNGTATYVGKQIMMENNAASEITWADGVEGATSKIANLAGFNYNNDRWYGTSYWLSSPQMNGVYVHEGYKLNNCAQVVRYDGFIDYDICDYYAIGVVPCFCI